MSKLPEEPAGFRLSVEERASKDVIEDARRKRREKLIRVLKATFKFVGAARIMLKLVEKIYEVVSDIF